MSDSDSVVRLQNLALWFRLGERLVTIDPRAAPPGTPEGAYRPVAITFAALEALLVARFMSAKQENECT